MTTRNWKFSQVISLAFVGAILAFVFVGAISAGDDGLMTRANIINTPS